jgi:hypothetical protein
LIIIEACGLALLAALNPAALLIGAVYLGSANPRKMILYYLLGAVAVTAIMAIALVLVFRAGGLSHVTNRTPRYGLRVGLGGLALAAAAVVARRRPPPGRTAAKQGRLVRLTARPSPWTAAVVGFLVFYPSVNFVGAVQVIATSNADTTEEAIGLVLVVLIVVLGVWLPLILHLIAPDATTRRLRAFDVWMRAHRRTLLIAGLSVGGFALILSGALGLAGTG